MQAEKYADAYDLFAQIRAEIEGKTEAQIKAEVTHDAFEKQIRELYSQWTSGEFSFGRFTELIGVPHWELWQILDAFGLPRYK